MNEIFTAILAVDVPPDLNADATGHLPETGITIRADGPMPFVQLIVRDQEWREALLIRDDSVANPEPGLYIATIPAGKLVPGNYRLQAEGCRTADIDSAGPDDWIKHFSEMTVMPQPASTQAVTVTVTNAVPNATPVLSDIQVSDRPKLYFGIHKHMHQPYYRAADLSFWDGMCDDIFSSRAGAYRHFIKMAADQYQPLPYAALSMSWSGSLIEQLDRISRDGLAHGAFSGDWKRELAEAAAMRTASGSPRAEFSGFGFYHPLMPLIPDRDIKAQILRHREYILAEFGVAASAYLFPPETAFHVRMIPALLEAGVAGVIYDSIHRYRACRDYPYAGVKEGMLPPNPAEQENPPVSDWLQLQNVWAGSKIAPSLLRPEYVKYVDQDGREYKIIAIPAERYIGNEDARGGFGALQYPDVLGQVLDAIEKTGNYDPQHPPFFLLHSDGDNHGGGSDSYYGSNTGAMVEWLKRDPRFELTGIGDYLRRFPPNPDNAVHIEPGSWSGADNGDPQFIKWFSGYNNPYSPDLNSWAVLTALQNAVHTMQDVCPEDEGVKAAERLLLTAEASDYWYWTGQDVWDGQVTLAANAAINIIKSGLDALVASGREKTGPTVFPPWVTPENPGGKTWGNNELLPADRIGTVHTFIHDVSGIKSARLLIRADSGKAQTTDIPLVDKGPYPTRTGATVVAHLYEAELPKGIGDIRYWVEAEDNNGNKTRGSLERVFLA